jgi:beta-galactosidase
VPLLVNVHGTEGGCAASFPIGISQLARSYSGVPGMLSGSDHYVGEMTLTATTDLYVLNAFCDASHDEDQALTSLEFEVGSGDYGGGHELDLDPSTVDLKTRLFVTQGNRILNYYLFAAGTTRRWTRRSATGTTGSRSPASGTGWPRRSAPRGS